MNETCPSLIFPILFLPPLLRLPATNDPQPMATTPVTSVVTSSSTSLPSFFSSLFYSISTAAVAASPLLPILHQCCCYRSISNASGATSAAALLPEGLLPSIAGTVKGEVVYFISFYFLVQKLGVSIHILYFEFV